jgi:hypothetical protein
VLKVQLDDFRAQRTAGMGGMFGPPDPKLRAAEETVDRRLAVINERLVPLLDSMAEDLENASDKTATLCAALATVMAKVFVTKDAKALGIIDKIPTFVSKEGKKRRFLGRFLNKEVEVLGHSFQLKHYDQVTYCNHSQGIIWGVGPQGYQCHVQKKWVHKVEELCVRKEKVKKENSGKIWGQLPESLQSREKAGLGSSLDLRTNLQVTMGSKNPSVSQEDPKSPAWHPEPDQQDSAPGLEAEAKGSPVAAGLPRSHSMHGSFQQPWLCGNYTGAAGGQVISVRRKTRGARSSSHFLAESENHV